eukprot:g56597.t1
MPHCPSCQNEEESSKPLRFVCVPCCRQVFSVLRSQLQDQREKNKTLESKLALRLSQVASKQSTSKEWLVEAVRLESQDLEQVQGRLQRYREQVKQRRRNVQKALLKLLNAQKLVTLRSSQRKYQQEHSDLLLATQREETRLCKSTVHMFAMCRLRADRSSLLGLSLANDLSAMVSRIASSSERRNFSTAMGYLILILQLISSYLDVPLVREMFFVGSRSSVLDIEFERDKVTCVRQPLWLSDDGSVSERECLRALQILDMNLQCLYYHSGMNLLRYTTMHSLQLLLSLLDQKTGVTLAPVTQTAVTSESSLTGGIDAWQNITMNDAARTPRSFGSRHFEDAGVAINQSFVAVSTLWEELSVCQEVKDERRPSVELDAAVTSELHFAVPTPAESRSAQSRRGAPSPSNKDNSALAYAFSALSTAVWGVKQGVRLVVEEALRSQAPRDRQEASQDSTDMQESDSERNTQPSSSQNIY